MHYKLPSSQSVRRWNCLTSSVIVFLCGQLLDFQLTANVLVHRELLMMTAYLHVGCGGNFLILKRVALSLQLSRPVDGGKKKQLVIWRFYIGLQRLFMCFWLYDASLLWSDNVLLVCMRVSLWGACVLSTEGRGLRGGRRGHWVIPGTSWRMSGNESGL